MVAVTAFSCLGGKTTTTMSYRTFHRNKYVKSYSVKPLWGIFFFFGGGIEKIEVNIKGWQIEKKKAPPYIFKVLFS